MEDYKFLRNMLLIDLIFNIFLNIIWMTTFILKSVYICTNQTVDGWDCAIIILAGIGFGAGIISIADIIHKMRNLKNKEKEQQNETVD